ncbi:hypothetical protein J2X69_000405 [Algoriphagus sp. 4150]|uniref:TaqI-like C-terminal specificity domain-containing protein n=1 Tax=Algoriphagus sp. 4150 TaxID=2817756 RepID=UPI0028617E74|nr:TaqI-like C-terminal specificity domain-containing protein [Algoriphagus sp. 4150]MDR7128077.1 hypothetical protein [Algoriphagus sp. 4150]
MPQSSFSSTSGWVILSEIEARIKAKIEEVGTPLKDWDVQINYGIKTGFNEAFIIDQKTRDQLVEKCPKADQIIRPILRGRDISKYSTNFANIYILYIPWHFPLHLDKSVVGNSTYADIKFKELYPEVYNHLEKHKSNLEKRNKSETGIRYEWYALQRWGANYWEDFFKSKIVWGEISDTSKFAYVEDGVFIEATSFMMTGKNLKYLLGMLNSKLAEWYFNQIGTATGVGTNRWKKYTIEQLPICLPQSNTKDYFESLVSIAANNPTPIILEEIDRTIYKMYGLVGDEIEFFNK